MSATAIIDYGMCNLDSIRRAVDECGGDAVVTDDPKVIEGAGYVIIPGVGAFPDAMRNICRRRLDAILRERAAAGVAMLGICLGMQLLATRGTEGGEVVEGLGLVPGEVRRLEPAGGERIPHIGWNEVTTARSSPLLNGIADSRDFYFVHSYHFACANEDNVVARTSYCGGFVSIIEHGNVHGTQFHPEKSQAAGFQLLRNFLAL